MKHGLLVYPHNHQNIFNIGDYVQSIAAKQFLPNVDIYLNREQLNQPIEERTIIILNGWFMHNPINWPPTNAVSPLFVAFHMNKLAEQEMLSDEGIEYLKKNQPIGCRDYHTVELLKSKGIDAYFSGCLTLTLGLSYHHVDIPDAPIYITDLNSTLNKDFKFKLRCFLALLFKRSLLNKIHRRIHDCGIKKHLRSVTAFYVTYKKVISDDVFTKAVYREQEINDNFSSDDEKFKYADALLKDYSKARYVITSRIHCALPCLAMETPVVFVTNDLLGDVHNCRLDGLLQLFHTIHITKSGISLNIPGISQLKCNSIFNNKGEYLSLAKQLIITCRNFIDKNKQQ